MVCGRSFVLSPRGGANVRGRPDKGKQDKTKRNRDKTARQRLGSCRDPCQPNQSFLVKAAGFYPPSPYTTYNHPVSTPDTMGPDCCSYSNAPCFSLMNRSPAQWEGCSPDLENPQKIQKLLAFKCEPTQEEHVKHNLFYHSVGAVGSHVPGDTEISLSPQKKVTCRRKREHMGIKCPAVT